jgi:hypothetical protein
MKWNHKLLLWFGLMAVAQSVFNSIVHFMYVPPGHYITGLHLADSDMALIGVLALVLSKCLKQIEDRLAKLESE